jgi:glucose-1-phosphate thymidylyltransferase
MALLRHQSMKGVILAGGTGSRLYPLTKTVNKHILPVYDKPMICYPLETLKSSGIDDILIISAPGHAGQFLELLGSGYDLGLDLSYTIQEKPLGIAHAIWIAENFADGEDIAVILGDNIIGDTFQEDITSFDGGAKVFLSEVEEPERFGIADIQNGEIKRLVEKPDDPPTNLAMTGMYLYDSQVFDYASDLELSDRDELEVTDLNRVYLEQGELDYRELDDYWFDAGTFEGLYQAGSYLRERKQSGDERGVKIQETDWGQRTQATWDVSREEI